MRLSVLSVLLASFAAWYNIGCFSPYLPLFAFETLGASHFMVGILTTVYWCSNTPSATLHGYIVDRYGKPRLILGIALLALALTDFTILLVSTINDLVILRIIQGIVAAPIIPLTNLLASYELGAGKGVGYVGSIGALGFLSGSVLGSILTLTPLRYVAVFLSAGFIILISSLTVIISRGIIVDTRLETSRFKFEYLKHLPFTVWIVYIVMMFRQIGATGIWALFPLFVKDLGGNEFIVGLAFALNTISQVFFMRFVARYAEKWGLQVIATGLILSTIVFIGYYLSYNYVHILPLQILLGISWSALTVGSNVHIIKNVRSEVRATALGLLMTFHGSSWVIGSYANSVISEVTKSLKEYMILSSILTFTASLLIITVIFKLKRRE